MEAAPHILIRETRHQLDMTQEKFGRLLSFAGETVDKWERGEELAPEVVNEWCRVIEYLYKIYEMAPKYIRANNNISHVLQKNGTVAAISYITHLVRLFSLKPPER